MHNARVPNNWLAAPNMGQTVEIVPVAINQPHAPTTSALDRTTPGHQLIRRRGA